MWMNMPNASSQIALSALFTVAILAAPAVAQVTPPDVLKPAQDAVMPSTLWGANSANDLCVLSQLCEPIASVPVAPLVDGLPALNGLPLPQLPSLLDILPAGSSSCVILNPALSIDLGQVSAGTQALSSRARTQLDVLCSPGRSYSIDVRQSGQPSASGSVLGEVDADWVYVTFTHKGLPVSQHRFTGTGQPQGILLEVEMQNPRNPRLVPSQAGPLSLQDVSLSIR